MNDLLLKYAKLGIYIEVQADCFTMAIDPDDPNEQQVCWRPFINWFANGAWQSDDCGCSSDLEKMLRVAEAVAAQIFLAIYDGVPLDFKAIPPRKSKRLQ